MDFVDLKAQQQRIGPNLRRRIEAVLTHGKYILGPEVVELEERLAAYTGAAHCVSCASGTDALLMALMARGIGPGDAVFTTPFTFFATAEVIALTGATPVFVDIDPVSFNIDPAALDRAVDSLAAGEKPSAGAPIGLRPAGVIAVDLFGLPADYDSVNAIARRHGLFVLEDAAQSFGASYRGRRSCALAEMAATSFYPAKPLGAYGEGGAVFTNNPDEAAVLRSIRVHGMGESQYDNVRIGINGRLDTLQAAILLAKLDVFDDELQFRQHVARGYTQILDGCVSTPQVREGYQSAWAQYSVLTDRRDALIEALRVAQIPAMIYYPVPLHLQKALAWLGYRVGDMPCAESCAQRIVSLPMHPYLTEEDLRRVGEVVCSVVSI